MLKLNIYKDTYKESRTKTHGGCGVAVNAGISVYKHHLINAVRCDSDATVS